MFDVAAGVGGRTKESYQQTYCSGGEKRASLRFADQKNKIETAAETKKCCAERMGTKAGAS